jgi:hypothetical protein
MDGLADEIGDFSQGGLNCNLEPGSDGKKRRTGEGIMAADDWPALLQLFKDKGVPADQKEVAERADEDKLFDLDVVRLMFKIVWYLVGRSHVDTRCFFFSFRFT